MDVDNLCTVCEKHEEYVRHLFRDYLDSKLVLQFFFRTWSSNAFYSTNVWKNWLKGNLSLI